MLIQKWHTNNPILVDCICEKHEGQQPIQVLPGSQHVYTKGVRPSLVIILPAPINGEIKADAHIQFPCNDSCGRNWSILMLELTVRFPRFMPGNSLTRKIREIGRDLNLFCTIEVKTSNGIEVLARRKISVWIKVTSVRSDLFSFYHLLNRQTYRRGICSNRKEENQRELLQGSWKDLQKKKSHQRSQKRKIM